MIFFPPDERGDGFVAPYAIGFDAERVLAAINGSRRA
jgi:hypothetical protein